MRLTLIMINCSVIDCCCFFACRSSKAHVCGIANPPSSLLLLLLSGLFPPQFLRAPSWPRHRTAAYIIRYQSKALDPCTVNELQKQRETATAATVSMLSWGVEEEMLLPQITGQKQQRSNSTVRCCGWKSSTLHGKKREKWPQGYKQRTCLDQWDLGLRR